VVLVGVSFSCTPNKHWRYHRAAHLFCDGPDSLDELHQIASKIGLKRQWFQDHPTMPHYDLTESKRVQAIRKGAKSVDLKTEVKFIRQWREIKKELQLMNEVANMEEELKKQKGKT
jgi:hypothetical protein